MRAGLVLAALLALGGQAAAQSLGEMAAEEKKRKKDPGAKTYTDEDLAKLSEGQPRPSPAPPSRTGPGPTGDSRPSESHWRGGARDRREGIRGFEAKVAEIEAKIAGLRGPLSPPEPGDALKQDPYNLFTVDERRKALEAELQTARAGLALAQKELEDFEEQARRQGIPPGWLRE